MAKCAICLDDLQPDPAGLRVLPCGHSFHPKCVDRWVHDHRTCPTCRAPTGDPPEDSTHRPGPVTGFDIMQAMSAVPQANTQLRSMMQIAIDMLPIDRQEIHPGSQQAAQNIGNLISTLLGPNTRFTRTSC